MDNEKLFLQDLHFSADGTQMALNFKTQESMLVLANNQAPAAKTTVLHGTPVIPPADPMSFMLMCLAGVILKQQEAIEGLESKVRALSETK